MFHKYENWKIKNQGEILDYTDKKNPLRIGSFLEQTRQCKRCGYTQIDRQQKFLDPTMQHLQNMNN